MTARELGALLSTIPEMHPKIGVDLLASQRLEDWVPDSFTSDRFSLGVPALGLKFDRFGRSDIREALANTLLSSSGATYFAIPEQGIAELSWFLELIGNGLPITDKEQLVRRIASADWLQNCFDRGSVFSLTNGIMGIVLHQTAGIIRHIWCPQFDRRLEKASRELSTATHNSLAANVSFLAAGALAGRPVSVGRLDNTAIDRLTRLPIDVLPHDAEATHVGDRHRQLWIGMRLLARSCVDSLVVEPYSIQQTLALWEANLEGRGVDASSNERRVNTSMVRWLSTCSSSGMGTLVGDDEPFWLLTGFTARDMLSLFYTNR
jgi:hypothetical protein